MTLLHLQPVDGPVHATVEIPGSKSLTNRALVMAALADGTSILSNALFAEDTEHMIATLEASGFAIAADPGKSRVEITGRGGHVPETVAELFCGNSGTTLRFCTALVALGYGRFRLDGVKRMRERPISQLVDALRVLGAGVEFHGREGYPPLTVHAQGLTGGTVTFKNPASSQFISALLMAAPAAANDVLIDVAGPLVSAPYVSMTTALMGVFGATAIEEVQPQRSRFIVPAPQPYRAVNLEIEPDASNASYFLAAPAVAGGEVTVTGIGTSSIQGDARFVDVLEMMGCCVERAVDCLTVRGPGAGEKLRPLNVDLNDMPDMVQTAAVLALFADGRSVLRNVANLRLKEADRLSALAHELTALGAGVEEHPDGLAIEPPGRFQAAAINTYDDHRMAMSFALAGLAVEGIVINDPECVGKTFPDFFERWARLSRSQQ
ncbi:MAG: 3-phosphoshikimate 1-carboxyvinyltransferase [Phycisphaerae bacterium]